MRNQGARRKHNEKRDHKRTKRASRAASRLATQREKYEQARRKRHGVAPETQV